MRALTYKAMLLLLTACSALAQVRSTGAPQWKISNNLLRLTLYLPDTASGFYRGTKFDWSGVIADLQYEGHSYYGPWFTRTDPNVLDFIYEGSDIVAGPCSAITGPVEEFTPALGYEDAKPGGTFVKIGVGVLRKQDNKSYSPYRLFQIVDPGKWSVIKGADSVEFTQEIHDPSSGYGYIYQKKISLLRGKPEMLIEHTLKNTGTRRIRSSVYDHNFLVLDKQPPSPAFTITFPFGVTMYPPPDKELAKVLKNQILYGRTLSGEDSIDTAIQGFSKSSADYKIRIENINAKAGMTIAGDRPLVKAWLWSIRSVLAVEPFIDISLEPGSQSEWRYEYEFYTLPRSNGN
jgi:hypothetical protein